MLLEQLLLKALEHGILAEVLFGKLTGQTAALGPQLGAFDQLLKHIRKGWGIAGWGSVEPVGLQPARGHHDATTVSHPPTLGPQT